MGGSQSSRETFTQEFEPRTVDKHDLVAECNHKITTVLNTVAPLELSENMSDMDQAECREAREVIGVCEKAKRTIETDAPNYPWVYHRCITMYQSFMDWV